MTNYTSTSEVQSSAIPGVRFYLRRISFGRRLELGRALRDHLETIESLALTGDSPARKAQTALLSAELDAIHIRWGLAAIEGLEIDGAPATADSLIESGPEELIKEILEAIRHETGLDAEERKNSAPPSTSCADAKPDRVMPGSAANASSSGFTSNATASASSPSRISPTVIALFGDGGPLS